MMGVGGRDPFPMASEEAKAMAESMPADDATSSSAAATASLQQWNTMTTTTNNNNNVPTAATTLSTHADKSEQQLLGRSGGNQTSKKEHADDDIYASIEHGKRVKNDDEEDDFMDRPLWESRASSTGIVGAVMVRLKRWGERIFKRLYGDQIDLSELVRVLTLATTLFFMIGGYWLLRSLKDSVLAALCGITVIPKAKIMSVFVVLGVVSIYNKFLDSDIPKHQLFYIFGTFYFALFMIIAILLMHPTIGLANEKPSPWRILGWVSYCSIESFGSVMVSLFWSFANSNISLETAKASYGVMVATAQVGSILGPTFVNIAAPKIGPAKCYCVGAVCILLLQGSMRTYVRRYGVSRDTKAEMNHNDDAKPKKKEKPGVLEGLVLFWKHNYVKGIFAISCLFMVEVTIIDFTMKLLAQEYFAEEYPCQPGMSCYDAVAPGVHGSSAEATAAFSAFMGFFGQAANTLSFLLSLLGTSAVIRYLGLRLTLLLFPSLCLLIIITVRLHPTLYVVFGAMMTLKGCSYGLNNPTKEILYQPTSTAVRYKAKSWIDIFGARGSKAVGSLVTNAFSDSAKHLVANGSIVGMMVASFLIWNATFMGRKFDEYTSTGYIVGGDNDEDKSNIEMAMNQNENEDTSCAIYDDDEVGPEEEGQRENGSSHHDDDDQEEDDAGENTADFAKKPEVQRV